MSDWHIYLRPRILLNNKQCPLCPTDCLSSNPFLFDRHTATGNGTLFLEHHVILTAMRVIQLSFAFACIVR